MSLTENQEQLALSLHTQASISLQEGKTEDAIRAYKEVISLKPDWAEAYRNLARVLGNIGELKESANYWYQAFNLEPNWPTASDYLALGNMLVQVQQLEDAETCYHHSIALNSNAVEPYHNLGEICIYKRKFDEAIVFYHQGLKFNPDYSSCYLGLGKAFAQKNEWENAIAAFRKAISLTPDAPQLYHHLGNSLEKIGNKEDALSCYQKALEINPELWDVYQRLGEFFAQELKLEEAIEAYQKAIEINPQAYLSHHQLGQTLFKMKRWEEAVTCARRAIEIYPNTPWCYTQLGNNLIELGKEEDAIVCHRKAAALRGWIQCEERAYEFTRDWFTHNIPIWQKYLEHLANINGLNIVEIGSFQGMSTCWLLDNILTAPNAKITCIEPGFQPQFDPNIDKTGAGDKVIKLEAFSQDVLGNLETEAFDLAYIDGCHLAESVLQDAILSWRVVKVGGLIIFDDYEWYDPESLLMITKMGVDIFLEMFKNRFEVLHQGYQLIIKKIAPDVPNNALEVDQNQLISAQAYQALADALKQQGDVDSAIKHYRKAVELGNIQVETYENLGKLLQAQRNFEDAIIAYQKVLDLNPHAGDIAYSLGEMSFDLERWEDAVNYYHLALTINGNLTEIYPNLGNAFFNLKRWEDAIISYRHGIDNDQDFFWVYHHLGEALLNLEKWQDAGEAFSHAIEKNPENSWSYCGLGTAFLKQEKWQDAVTAYQKANQLNPNSFDSYFSLGDALMKLEQWDDAVIAYQRAAELNPDFSWCYQSLGDAFLRQQKWEDAARAYQSAIALNPDFFGSYHNLGEALFNLQKWDEAITAYQKVIELKPDFSLPYSRLETIASLSQSQEINSNSFQTAFEIGKTLQAQEKWEDAVNAYRHAIPINPNHPWAYYNLGEALAKLSQWEDAIIAYRQAILLNPDFWGSYHQLGDALLNLENYGEARDAYRHAIALNSDLAWSYHNLGIALSKLEQWEEAIIAYRHAIEKEPQIEWFYENLGEALQQLEKWEEALLVYQKAIELEPNKSWLYSKLGDIFSQLERWPEALDAYHHVLDLEPHQIWLRKIIGDIQIKLGQIDSAIYYYFQALEKEDNIFLKQHLGNMCRKRTTSLSTLSDFWLQQNQNLPEIQRSESNNTVNEGKISASFYDKLGDDLFELNKFDGAIVCYELARIMGENNSYLKEKLETAWQKKQELDQKLENYWNQIKAEPKSSEAFVCLGNLLGELGEEKDAIVCHQKAARLRGWSFCETKDYHFTQNWFTDNISVWEKYLGEFRGYPGLQVLEIGSFQGMSTCWFLDYLLTEDSAKITSIDMSFQKEFQPNIKKTGSREKVIYLQGKSEKILPTLNPIFYDIIYIDGCHLAPYVLQDAILSWPLLKVGGLIIFDDYDWCEAGSQIRTTRLGIDTFLEMIENSFELIYKGYQVLIKKITDTRTTDINIKEKLSAQAYEKLAQNLEKEGKLDLAILHYQKAVESDNNDFKSYEKLGDSFRENQLLTEAIKAYQKALNLNPKALWATSNLGQVFLALQRWEDAAETYRRAIEIDPTFSWSYYSLGETLCQQKKWQEAVEAYQKSIEFNPDFFGAYHQLGEVFSKLEQWEDAVKAYQHSLELKPDLSWSHHNLGRALFQQEKWEEAVVAYRHAIALAPNINWFYQNLGEALRKLERWDEAIIAYSRSIELDPNSLWVYEILVELLQKQGRINDEIALYQKMIELEPNSCSYYNELGQLLMEKEQWEDAIATFVKALQIKPDYSLEIYDTIAQALEKLGFPDDAYGCYLNKQLSDHVLNKYCHLTEDLLTTSQTHPSLTHIDIYPANLLHLSPTKKISDSALLGTQTPTEKSLLSVGSDGKIGWDLMTTIIAPETFVVVVPEGRAWGDSVTTAIITEDNKLVINVSTKGNAELIISSNKLTPPELINGTVAFLSVKWGSLGYFHWMLDLITRIHLLSQSGFSIEKIDKFVVNSYDKPYQKETLTLLGIPAEKIIDSSHFHHIKAQTLVVPSLQFQGIYKLCNWACDFLKESFLKEKYTANKRIYISREAPYPRKISNNDEVSQYLEKLGFEKVLLERMSVEEQALCLASAEIVVAPHGAGLTNLVFCHPGTKVIEIFSPLYMPPEYWLLSNVCGLEHFSCIGELLDKQASRYDVYQDIVVNINQLQELLTMAGVING